MKHCQYCDTTYAKSVIECPSCGARDFETECDNCGTTYKGTVCPNCGVSINEKPRDCPKCGHQMRERVCPKCGYDTASTATVLDAVASVASKAACNIRGHSWLGCKCTRCGETRDMEHAFKPIAGKCEQKCSVCEKTTELPHQWNGTRCVRCGVTKGPTDKLWGSIEDRLPFLHLEKKDNRNIVVGLGGLFVLVLASLLMIGLGSAPPSDGRLRMPEASTFEGENYQDVLTELQQAGFTNIETDVLDDLVFGWLTKDGDVESVSVDGNEDYSADVWYPNDVEIVITYHTFPQKEEGASSSETTPEPTAEPIPEPTPSSPQTSEAVPSASSETYKYEGPEYDIVDSHSTGIGLTQYWVYADKFDYSTDAYKEQVKAIIMDVAHKESTDKLIVCVVTDKEIIYFESDNTIKEYMDKYGMDYYANTIAPKEETDWVAWYTGGFDSNTGQKSDENSAYEIVWLPSSEDAAIEQWKPNLTP